ncbi:MAG TPA: hypothetical protein VMH36_09640 [Alphaproteobacteria bacterium]|nr:hypothetical protein [Alphaproteobacteria bacterium]
MIFNFVLANHHETSLNSLGDLLEPIYQGLEANGHHVIRFGIDFHEAPAINVMVEFFKDDVVVEDLLRFKRELGDRFVFGLLGTEDPEDDLVMAHYPRRRPNLRRLAGVADFVWTLLPVAPYYEAICGPGRVAWLRYGFSAGYVEPDMIADPRLRDIDVLLYGNPHPYRDRIVQALNAGGLTCVGTQREAYPDFVAADLIRRAKILLDVRRSAEVRFLSPTRIMRGLHSGTAVVSERYDVSPLAYFYDYVSPASYEELPDRCREIIKSGSYVGMADAALAKFRAETSMAANVTAALALPVFERLANPDRAGA